MEGPGDFITQNQATNNSQRGRQTESSQRRSGSRPSASQDTSVVAFSQRTEARGEVGQVDYTSAFPFPFSSQTAYQQDFFQTPYLPNTPATTPLHLRSDQSENMLSMTPPRNVYTPVATPPRAVDRQNKERRKSEAVSSTRTSLSQEGPGLPSTLIVGACGSSPTPQKRPRESLLDSHILGSESIHYQEGQNSPMKKIRASFKGEEDDGEEGRLALWSLAAYAPGPPITLMSPLQSTLPSPPHGVGLNSVK